MAGETSSSGWGYVIPKQSIYALSTTPLHRVGDKCRLGDRVFAYAKNGTAAALAPGKLTQGAAITAADNFKVPVAANAAVGAKKLQITADQTVVKNFFCNGWLTHDTAGAIYRIKDHLAMASATAVWVNLFDPLAVAITTSHTITMTPPAQMNTVIAPNGGLTAAPAGVPLITVTQGTSSVDYYYWSQTWGPCNVLIQGTIVIGCNVGLGGTADGAVGPIAEGTAAGSANLLGHVMRVADSGGYGLIYLRIEC